MYIHTLDMQQSKDRIGIRVYGYVCPTLLPIIIRPITGSFTGCKHSPHLDEIFHRMSGSQGQGFILVSPTKVFFYPNYPFPVLPAQHMHTHAHTNTSIKDVTMYTHMCVCVRSRCRCASPSVNICTQLMSLSTSIPDAIYWPCRGGEGVVGLRW